ncbi:hypothetical protein Syun_021944 [Stephania yunnanensis]|uniref:Mediator of RNA polymerase II transcription subunit 23 n=1 Tax=Stephania yunnanensis TaxID=152371 RepID=A0AAP0NPK0_9MAGN
MDQNQRSTSSSSASRIQQLHPSRSAIVDLFNLYLGRNSRHSGDDSIRETPNKLQKRITALGFGLPPPNEQFILDFELLVNQFPDQEHLRAVTESVLIALVVKCCNHAPQAEFILFALRSLHSIEYVNWDTFLPALLSSVSSAESSQGQGNQAANANSLSNMSQSGIITSSAVVANSSNFQPSTPASPLASIHGIGSPAQSASELTPCTTMSPIRFPDVSGNGLQSSQRPALRDNAVSSLRQISCKIILIGLELDLKPVTHAGIFSHMMNWLVNWDQRQQVVDESNGVKSWKPDRILHEWLHCCLDVVWLLVDENKCRIPFYELIRSGLQFIESIPDDEALFAIVLEIHRRRDMVAMHMQMLDQHLHCPSFGNPRFMSQASPSTVGEPSANTRYSPITYPSVLGEPLHGEDLALSIQKGSLDWERALRCLRHALRTTPSPDWWRRVLLVAPCYKAANQQVPTPGAIFSSEMVYESLIDRIMELLKLTTSGNILSYSQCWQEWLIFSDVFFFLMKSGCMDFLDFVDKLASRVNQEDPQILRSNHVTWLLAQIIRIEIVTNALNTDPKKVETTRKILSFHKEDKSSDPNNVNPRSILLDFISSSQTLRIWSINASIRDYLNPEQLQKGKQIDEWWKQATKGERMVDFMNFDERSIGMFWILSYTMAQPACEAVMNWLTAPGIAELVPGSNVQTNERVTVMRECCPLSMSLLSGLSINACLKLVYQIEESLFVGQVIPSVAMVETYVRLLLIHPHSLFRSHFPALIQRSSGTGSSILSKPGATLLLLEILNYRLIPLYRADALLFADFFVVKKELKGPSEFTETLNRVAILSLAITIKTRGISEVEHLMFLPSLIEQIMATCQHTWSEKTMRYFPPLIREHLTGRMDKRVHATQAWQQGCVLREFSPEEVTSNIYQMVDVLLLHTHTELQHGRLLQHFAVSQLVCLFKICFSPFACHQDILLKASGNLAVFVWKHELFPLDILILALIDRDDDPHALRIVISLLERPEIPQRIKLFCINRGPPEHWLHSGISKRTDLQKALGNHLSWKERFPPFFDDLAGRLLPVIPLVVYRLIENDATEATDKILAIYSSFLAYHPMRFTFVRDILAYFYGHLSSKIIVRLLKVLDVSKIPFSESFPQHIASSNPAMCPPPDYFATLLLGLVNNVMPSLNSKSKSGSVGDAANNSLRGGHNKTSAPSQSGSTNVSEGQKAFYQCQDPGTYTQLVLETATIELLALPASPPQIVSSLVQIVVHVQPTLIQSSNGLQGTSTAIGSTLPTSPSGGSAESLNTCRSNPSASGINCANFVSRSGYTSQQLSCLLIQACGLLLAQLPPEFHAQLYLEVSRIIKECWWLTDGKRSMKELDSAVGYALLDPTWAAQDNTSTPIVSSLFFHCLAHYQGNIVALLHAFFSNLPQEWLEGTHATLKHLQPVTSVAMLRVAFHVFGRNSQPSTPCEATEIVDLIDFLHHALLYEGQGGPVQTTSKPKPETLTMCAKAIEMLRPDVQHLLFHIQTDPNSSIYAATHPKLGQNPSQ